MEEFLLVFLHVQDIKTVK